MTDFVLKPAATGLASSADYNRNLTDTERSLMETFGAGVLSGGVVTAGSGLSVNVNTSRYLLGITLDKQAATNVPVVAMRSGGSTNVLWAVPDVNNADRCVYQVTQKGTPVFLADGTTLAAVVAEIDTDGSHPTAIRYGTGIGRTDFLAYATLLGQIATAAAGKVPVDAADTTPDYLADKIAGTANISTAVLSPGGDETLQLDVTPHLESFDATVSAVGLDTDLIVAVDFSARGSFGSAGYHVTIPPGSLPAGFVVDVLPDRSGTVCYLLIQAGPAAAYGYYGGGTHVTIPLRLSGWTWTAGASPLAAPTVTTTPFAFPDAAGVGSTVLASYWYDNLEGVVGSIEAHNARYGGGAAQSVTRQQVYRPGTLTALGLKLTRPLVSAETMQAQVYVSGVLALTVNLAVGAAYGVTTGSVALVAGDVLHIVFAPSAMTDGAIGALADALGTLS